MIHLSDDDIFQLAEITDENLIYTETQLKMMDHLKSCELCYTKFCGAMALMEVMGESGSAYLSSIYAENRAKAGAVVKVLAVINLIKRTVHGKIETIIEQSGTAGNDFNFQPSFAMAARGTSGAESNVYKLEDSDDEKTFVAIDPKRKELLLQINSRKLKGTGIKAYLQLKSGEGREIRIEQKGKFFIGRMNNLPDEEASLVIQETNA